MKHNKEIIEAMINRQGLLLKWQGIPSFAFLSGLAALVWILVSNKFYLMHLNYIIVLAVFVERIMWAWLNYSEIENLEAKEVFRGLLILKKDILKDLWREIVQVGLCFYFVWNWETPSSILLFYFVGNLLMVISVLFLNNSEKFNDPQVHKSAGFAKKRWTSRAVFVLFLFLNFFMAKIVYDQMIKQYIFDHEQIKSLVLVVGAFLLVRFYQSGRAMLTVLLFKKDQLIKELENEIA